MSQPSESPSEPKPEQPTTGKTNPSSQAFHGDPKLNIRWLLQKLHEHNRANIPALAAERAQGAFTLQEESAPDEATHDVSVLVYPQNPFVSEPEIRRMNRQDIRPGLLNSRVRIQSNAPPAQPDADGNYLYWPGTPEFDQVSVFYYTTFTLRMWERYAKRAIPWAFPRPRLNIDPHVGDLANAFYNEQERLLGFHRYLTTEGDWRSTAQSADIVSHETAHAVLDGLRDLYNESFSLGPRAFHESFGDITAVLVALHDDSLVHRLLEWTSGDLRTSTFLTEIAEHLTQMLQQGGNYFEEHTIYLRNAFNELRYEPFEVLPYWPSDPATMLGRQEHNYSRLFTGALYDLLVGVYEHFKETMQPYVALIRARDTLGNLLVNAIELGPVGEFDYSDMAQALLTADAIRCDGQFMQTIKAVFANRGILTESAADTHLAQLTHLPDIQLPASINNAMSAGIFLQETILPALANYQATASNQTAVDAMASEPVAEFIPMNTYRNGDGYVYMSFFTVETTQLVGDQYRDYSGSEIDLYGGLTLMFGPDDRLCSLVYRPVLESDRQQVRSAIADLIAYDKISDYLLPSDAAPDSPPRGLAVAADQRLQDASRMKIVKYPVIFDNMPKNITGLVEYVRHWLKNDKS